MKINSNKILMIFGIATLVFSLFAIAPSVNAYAYDYEYDDCEYYGDCDDYYYEDDCEYYGDCDDYYYEDDCEYYGDCDDYYYEDDCEYYDDCDDYYYENDSTQAYIIENYNTIDVSANSNAVNNNVNINNAGFDNGYDYEEVDGYCYANETSIEEGDVVTWTAEASGGDGYYTFEWSGSEDLFSYYPVISKRYDNEGRKSATVEIYSDGVTITRTCYVNVEDEDRDHDRDEDLDAYCKAYPDEAEIGDRIKWTVYPEGGDGRYDYDWDGDENLNGDDKSITKTYKSTGRKEAEVRVKSDGDSVTVRCYADVEKDHVVYNPPAHTPTGGIYLSSIPATGIAPNLKIALFSVGILMWSAFLSYLYIARKNEKMREAEALGAIGE